MRLEEELDGFFRLLRRDERLGEQTLECGVVRVRRHEPGQDRQGGGRVVEAQIDHRERLQRVAAVDDGRGGVGEGVARVGEPAVGGGDGAQHHPARVERVAVVAFGDSQFLIAERVFGLSHRRGHRRERIRGRRLRVGGRGEQDRGEQDGGAHMAVLHQGRSLSTTIIAENAKGRGARGDDCLPAAVPRFARADGRASIRDRKPVTLTVGLRSRISTRPSGPAGGRATAARTPPLASQATVAFAVVLGALRGSPRPPRAIRT